MTRHPYAQIVALNRLNVCSPPLLAVPLLGVLTRQLQQLGVAAAAFLEPLKQVGGADHLANHVGLEPDSCAIHR